MPDIYTFGTTVTSFPALDDLTDVNVGTPGAGEDGYVLTWVDASSEYQLALIPGASFPALDDLTDVNVGTPGAGEDGYSVVWNDTAGEYQLAFIGGGGGSPGIEDVIVNDPVIVSNRTITANNGLEITSPGGNTELYSTGATGSTILQHTNGGTSIAQVLADQARINVLYQNPVGDFKGFVVDTTGVDLVLSGTRTFRINSSQGAAGQVFQSNGPGLPPSWAAVSVPLLTDVGNVTGAYADGKAPVYNNLNLFDDAFVCKTSTKTTTLYGQVNAGGSIHPGSSPGWSVAKGATGVYTITFTTAFASNAHCIVSVATQNGGLNGIANVNTTTTNTVVTIQDTTGTAYDANFEFFVIGAG